MTATDPAAPAPCPDCRHGWDAHGIGPVCAADDCTCTRRPPEPLTPAREAATGRQEPADAPTAPTVNGWTVGRPGAVYVGLSGIVETLTRDAVTIAGHTFPRGVGGAVRYVSSMAPAPTVVTCSGDCLPADDGEAERVQRRWQDAARRAHDEEHPGAFPLCGYALCRLAREPW